jgi:hypothetical protein
MRKRSMTAIVAIALLGGAAQVDARGGGFVGGVFHGGAFHGGAPHGMAPLITTHGPGSIAPIPPHNGPLYAVAPTDRRGDDRVQHDFRRDGDFRQDGDFRRDFRHDRDRFDGSGRRFGFPGGAINFAPRPPSRAIPVLYNYYYGASDNYYSNVASDYGAAPAACPGWRWDASGQARVWTDNCQR